ncbi:MAG TPA: YceI family protein [Acidimicrobiales bacterium]|nr:YceI family protein [Acidimicrobiales bacterium]
MDVDEAATEWPDRFEPSQWDPRVRRRRRRVIGLFAAGVAVLALGVVGGPAIYFHIEGAPPRQLTLPVGPGGTVGPLNGTWKVTPPSRVQYRVEEILFGQHHLAVGTTSRVSGRITIRGATVTSGQFTVDMATVRSDAAGRNVQFDDNIMDTTTYPNGYFTLTRAVDLGRVPEERHVVEVRAVGRLTLRGHSRTVTFPLRMERYGNGIDASGALTIHYAEWGIPNPSFAITRVGDTGTIAVLFHLVRSGR